MATQTEWIKCDNYLPTIPTKRDGTRLISDWCLVRLENGMELEAYYHEFYGWMKIGCCDGWRWYVRVEEVVLELNRI